MLQILNVGVEVGGAERSVRSLRDELVRRGHEVLVVSTDNKSDMGTSFADVVTSKRPAGNPLAQIWRPCAHRRLRDIIDTFGPDVVHLHNITDFGPAALWVTRRIPTILTVHGPEEYTLDLLPWLLPRGAFADPSAPGRRSPSGWIRYGWMRHVLRPAYRMGLRHVDVVVAPSRYMAGAVAADVAPRRIRQIYNGVRWPPRLPLPSGPALVFVGRLEWVKGVDVLLRAVVLVARAVPAVRLRIVGDGPERARLEALAATLGVADLVDLSGWVPADEVARAYAGARIVVIPSVWPENLPTVAIEGLAAGRPVVASRVGGIPEIVDDGVTGSLVPAGDAVALAGALVALLDDDATVGRMSEAGAVAARARFDVDGFVDTLEALYTELRDRPPP